MASAQATNAAPAKAAPAKAAPKAHGQNPAGFRVKYEVKPCPPKGLGLVATERIPKGTVCWHLTPDAGRYYDEEETRAELKKLGDKEKIRFWLNHCYAWVDEPNKVCKLTSDSELWNHSSNPNTGGIDDWRAANKEDPPDAKDPTVNINHANIALRDIEAGEELTDNYGTYDNPEFYIKLCKEYDVEWAGKVAELYS